MRGHKVITVERQGGYAARCEVEVDGEVQLCDITFGGFETRTAARGAIVHALPAVAAENRATAPQEPDGSSLYLGTKLSAIPDDEAARILGIHPAWVPTRRAGKRWTLLEALRFARHLGMTLVDVEQEARA